MKKIYKTLNVLAVIGILASCASLPEVSAEGQKVKVGKEAASKNCKDLGEIFGSANSNAYRSDQAAETAQAARNDLKNKAAKLGGNYVALETNNSAPYGQSGGVTVTLGGTAYSCP